MYCMKVSRGLKALDQHGALVADHGADPVVLMEGVGGGAGAALLAEAEVDAADDFALLVEFFEGLFHLAVEEHPAIDLDRLFGLEVFGVAQGRGGGVESAFDLVMDLAGFFVEDLADGEIGDFEAVVGDAMGVVTDGLADGPGGALVAADIDLGVGSGVEAVVAAAPAGAVLGGGRGRFGFRFQF